MSESTTPRPSTTKKDNIKEGDLMSFTHWVKVKHRVGVNWDGKPSLAVSDLDSLVPGIFYVIGDNLIESGQSADYFYEEKYASKTELAKKLMEAKNTPLTVCFETKNGGVRVLRGRLLSEECVLGRSYVEDLDLPNENGKSRTRLVDHRTIKWLVVGGTKYELRKGDTEE